MAAEGGARERGRTKNRAEDMDKYCPTYKWGQTETHLVITVDVNEECVKSHKVTSDGHVTVIGKVPGAGKGKFELFLDLDGKVLAEEVEVQKLPRSLKLKLKKQEAGVKWPRLQKEGIAKPSQEKIDFDFCMNSDDDSEEEAGADPMSSIPTINDTAAIAEQIKRKAAMAGIAKDITSKAKAAAPAPTEPPKKQSTMLFGPFPNPDGWDVALLLLALFHMYMSPHTKGEEAFNIQAMHDMLFQRQNLAAYDLRRLPDATAGTVVGALAAALAASPISLLAQLVLPGAWALRLSLYVLRALLALLSVLSLAAFRRQLRQAFGHTVAAAFALILVAQVAGPAGWSRGGQGSFASACVHLAFAYWLQEKYMHVVCYLTFAGVVFRGECLLLLAAIILHAAASNRLRPFPSAPLRLMGVCVAAAVLGLLVTVGLDSLFWGRLLWPEGEAMAATWRSATATDPSSISPWSVLWQALWALPRPMLSTLCFVPGGFAWNRRLRFVGPPMLAVLLLHALLLPHHPEVGLAGYSVVIFNAVAALELARAWDDREKREIPFLMALTVWALAFSIAIMLCIFDQREYPGADALTQLHGYEEEAVAGGLRPWVLLTPAATRLGASSFLFLPHPWTYSRGEGEGDRRQYTHVITSEAAVPGFTQLFAVKKINLGAPHRPPRHDIRALTLAGGPDAVKPVGEGDGRGDELMQTVMRVFKRTDEV